MLLQPQPLLPLLLAGLIHLCRGSYPSLVRCWVGTVSAVEESHIRNYSVRANVASTYGQPPPMLRVIRCQRPTVRLVKHCAMCLREERTRRGSKQHEVDLRCLSATNDCPVCLPKRRHARCSFKQTLKSGHQLVTSCCNFDNCSMTPKFDPQAACRAGALAAVPLVMIVGLFTASRVSS